MSEPVICTPSVRMEKTAFSVCVVTVTYGDRWHLLSQVLRTVARMPAVTKIIVVDNGATYDLQERLMAACGERAQVTGSGRNDGSARGFALGLQAAYEAPGAEYIWILDDDNQPAPDALEELCRCYTELATSRNPDVLALSALRTDRQYLMRIAAGADPQKVFARENSFLDFHIVDAPRRVFRKLFGRVEARVDPPNRFVRIPYGIYGGLFFHQSLLDRVGYPDEKFYLYGDDSDFTARISEGGGELFLAARSRVDDLETSWHVGHRRKITVFRNLMEGPDDRVFFTARNSVYFTKKWRLTNRLVWRINRTVYCGLIRVYMILHGRYERCRLIEQAVRDGYSGRMGSTGRK